MALASWSAKRILMLWAGGLVLQALLILAPVLLARHLIGNSGELLRIDAEQHARWRTAELADSLSLAKQRADARADRTYTVTASGDTLFPLVHVPSGRPDSASVAALGEQTLRTARYLTVVMLGLIPTVLVLVTVGWVIVRHRNPGSSRAFRAS